MLGQFGCDVINSTVGVVTGDWNAIHILEDTVFAILDDKQRDQHFITVASMTYYKLDWTFGTFSKIQVASGLIEAHRASVK
jgi:hypothetical protein